MNHVASQTKVAQRLNHVEAVYRPGERAVALALFDLLGFKTYDYVNGEVYVTAIDPPSWVDKENDNYLAGREVRPEQWAFDQALAKALKETPLATEYQAFKQFLQGKPDWGMHFGIRLQSVEAWEAAVAKLSDVGKHAPTLAGRVKLLVAHRPGDKTGNGLYQAFIWTDVIASGSLALGQHIEITTYLP